MAKPHKPTTDLEPDAPTPVELPESALPEAESVADDVPPGQDDVVELAAIDEAHVEAAPEPVRARKSGAFLGFVTGGILAAVIGFGAARFVIPEGWPIGGQTQATAALDQRIAEQEIAIAALSKQLAEATAAQAAVGAAGLAGDQTVALDALRADLNGAIAQRADAVEGRLSALADQLSGLDARLNALEMRPVDGGGVSSATLAAYEREMQAFRSEMEAQRGASATLADQFEAMAAETQAKLQEAEAQAAALKVEAEVGARAASARAALSRVQAALESGGPFAAALADMTAAGVAIPDILVAEAEAGVPSMPQLQRSFPEAARVGLEASIRASAGADWADRVTAFLKVQTGARSLEVREGNDPDAVLSRAEAALHEGKTDAALAEIAMLPPEGQAAMAGWVAIATRRLQAAAAVDTLVAALNGN